MERETVKKFDLEAAFKALDEIEAPAVAKGQGLIANRINLRERFSAKPAHEALVEDYYDVNDTEDLTLAQEDREAEVAKAKLARIEKIVDLDAETEDDVLPSYVGKYIIQCPQCMTLFYKDEADIETSDETPEVVNINEICQHCGNSSGYTLIGKVGSIDETEAENFDMNDVDLEDTSEAKPDEKPEEAADDLETTDADDEETINSDDLDLEDLPDEDEDEDEDEVEESLHNSELLKKIEKDNDLKTEIESDHLTLNEAFKLDVTQADDLDIDGECPAYLEGVKEVEMINCNKATPEQLDKITDALDKLGITYTCEDNLKEDIGDWYRRKFDKPASISTQQRWEDELNGEFGEISDERRRELEKKFEQQRDWERRHPSNKPTPILDHAEEVPSTVGESINKSDAQEQAEEKSELKTDIESEHLTLNEDSDLAEVEEFDEISFNEHLTQYMTEVYSNVQNFKATACSMTSHRLVVEGVINFKSGKQKTTKFIFENTKNGLRGYNSDFSDKRAFGLKTKVMNKALFTEALKYRYMIGEAIVRGNTKKSIN